MKLIQTLLEEKASTLKVINMMSQFLGDLSNKMDEVNINLKDIKKATRENREAIEQQTQLGSKQIIIEKQIGTANIPIEANSIEQSPEFIPTIDDTELVINTQNDNITTTTSKDFAVSAKSLKEE
jgi:diphthamide biosynthesis methyltransferase